MKHTTTRLALLVISLLLLLPLLVACGESAIATPPPTTAVTTTAAVTTAAVTTAAVTTAVVTAPTVSITVKPTLAPATTAPSTTAPTQTTATSTPATPPAVRADLFPVDPISKADPDLQDILEEYATASGTPDEKLKAAMNLATEIGAIDETQELEFELVLAKGAALPPVEAKIKAMGATVDDSEEIVDQTYMAVSLPFKTFVTYAEPTTKANFLRDLAAFSGVAQINLPIDQKTEELGGMPATQAALKDVLKARC